MHPRVTKREGGLKCRGIVVHGRDFFQAQAVRVSIWVNCALGAAVSVISTFLMAQKIGPNRTQPTSFCLFQSMSVSAKNRISNLYVDTLLLFIICRHSILLYLYVHELCTQLRLTTVFKE